MEVVLILSYANSCWALGLVGDEAARRAPLPQQQRSAVLLTSSGHFKLLLWDGGRVAHFVPLP